jgi:hypothetical protein
MPNFAAQCAFAAIFLAATSAAHAQQQQQQPQQQNVCGPMTAQPCPPEVISMRRGTVSLPYTLDTPFNTIQIGDPKVADVVAITERSFNILAQGNGITNIVLLNDQGVALKNVTVVVSEAHVPGTHIVRMYNLPKFGSQNYECSSTGCEFLNQTQYQQPKQIIESTNFNYNTNR